uniref:Fucolectin tachylectin-4 pentraxin-1 domain-containing protein n=1 Tax=Neogobius melanostomus TaxID=47308 RepID=A0A8C6V1W1_9GOBI
HPYPGPFVSVIFSLCVVSRTNVALRGKATQSDQYNSEYSAAYNAIDGNRDSNYNHGSCAVTKQQINPWWRVDLLEPYIITSITITNRGDCCPERLNGAEIHVGNSLLGDGNYNPLVAVIQHIPAGQFQTITFTSRVKGRYVNVLLRGNRLLTVCEVEVYGYRAPTGENLALKGKASQSSIYEYYFASNAIDGNRDGNFAKGSCACTASELNPWWRLDLGTTHRIFSVSVTNRDAVPERINGAEILIGDSSDNNGNNNPRCAVIPTIAGGFTRSFECNGMDGRYVNIVLAGRTEYLTLCEVEVYGSVLD